MLQKRNEMLCKSISYILGYGSCAFFAGELLSVIRRTAQLTMPRIFMAAGVFGMFFGSVELILHRNVKRQDREKYISIISFFVIVAAFVWEAVTMG